MVSVASPFTQDKDQYPKGSLQVLTWFFFSAIKWIHLCRLDRQEEKNRTRKTIHGERSGKKGTAKYPMAKDVNKDAEK